MVMDELLRLLLGKALATDGSGDIGRHEDEAFVGVPRSHSASAEGAAIGDRLQQVGGVRVALVLHVELAVCDEHADRALVGSEALVHMERLPRRHLFVLGNAVDELASRADRVHVHLAGVPVAEVAQAQRERAPDCDIHLVVASGSKP